MFNKMLLLCIGMFVVISNYSQAAPSDKPQRIPTTNGAVYHYGYPSIGQWIWAGDKIFSDHKQSNSRCETGGNECCLYDFQVVVEPFELVYTTPENPLQCKIEFINFLKHSAPYLLDPMHGYKAQVENGAIIPIPTSSEIDIIANHWL